jgi:hypothetical protein
MQGVSVGSRMLVVQRPAAAVGLKEDVPFWESPAASRENVRYDDGPDKPPTAGTVNKVAEQW